MRKLLYTSLFIVALISPKVNAQYQPKNASKEDLKKAQQWVDKTYKNLSQDEKLGQLFIVALYTNKGEDYISQVRNIVTNDKIGGLILMQDDAAREINLLMNSSRNQSSFNDRDGCGMGIVSENCYGT
jgi:hypothetical protein